MFLIASATGRITRWLSELEDELARIGQQDEWGTERPRIVFDTSALLREGEFDILDRAGLLSTERVRLVTRILVVRELDTLTDEPSYAERRECRALVRRHEGLVRRENEPDGFCLELRREPRAATH